MKKITLKIAGTLAIAGMIMFAFFPVSIAQNLQVDQETQVREAANVTGTWVGTRYQYDQTRDEFIASFDYIFELEQTGDQVTGSSYIKNGMEDFAEIKLRGKVVGDKLHFEEYAILDQKKPDHKVWCFKIGELAISQQEGVATLKGATNSFMAGYYIPCTGGFTALERIDDYHHETSGLKHEDANALLKEMTNSDEMMAIFPNPYVNNTVISYTLNNDATVQLKVFAFDGKEIVQLANENQVANQYNYRFSGNDYGFSSGAFIIELTIDGKVYSQQVIQVSE